MQPAAYGAILSAMRRILSVLLTLAAVGPVRAAAFSIGFTGASGKQGQICNQCHMGGTPPLVRFEGPSEMVAGSTATFRFIIESQSASQRHTGFNVASNDGTLAVISGQGAQLLAQELTHTAPKMVDDLGVATYDFLWTAPLVIGPQTLFGAGNNVNRNFNDSGDRAAAATLGVAVVAAATPTATPLPGCAGDCDRTDETTIEDVVRAVGLAATEAGSEPCLAADADRDGRIDFSEVLRSLAAALMGCAS